MTNEQAKPILESYIGQKRNELLALEAIESLFTTGYQSDQEAIKKGIDDGVAAQVEQAKTEAVATYIKENAIDPAPVQELPAEQLTLN